MGATVNPILSTVRYCEPRGIVGYFEREVWPRLLKQEEASAPCLVREQSLIASTHFQLRHLYHGIENLFVIG